MWPGFKDDEYVIQMTPSCNPVRLYCHGMNTATPREYITLQSGPERNFASFHRGRLLNFESCAGSVNSEPKLTANYWGTTRFNKIRLDPASGLVQRDDFQFSKTEGNPVRYGRAGDCYSAASKCHKGKFFIDLTGTGLRMRKEVEWEAWGTPKLPKRLVNVRKSQDGLTAIGECGGSCGGCEPMQEKMLLEPSTCTDASSTEAVSRQAIPIPRRTKKDEKGEKKSIVKIPQKIHVRSNLPYPHAKKVFQGPGSDESEMEVIGHVTKKKRRSESKKKKRNLTEGKTADQ
ncbi:A disintegrin and metalloproteinase with thrombospondin motifs 9-like [Acropora muricata]